jgi:hypothetical protein
LTTGNCLKLENRPIRDYETAFCLPVALRDLEKKILKDVAFFTFCLENIRNSGIREQNLNRPTQGTSQQKNQLSSC